MVRVAVLDDYQDVARKMTDWSVLPADVEVAVFRDHLTDQAAVAERLKDFDIVMAMRERTPFPRTLLEQLPRLQLLTTTGMRNAAIDLQAAADCNVLVCGTGGILSDRRTHLGSDLIAPAAYSGRRPGYPGGELAGQSGSGSEWQNARPDGAGTVRLRGGQSRQRLSGGRYCLESKPDRRARG
jgi:hypothetical protein